MPNGHGGVPRFSMPLVIAVLGALIHVSGLAGRYDRPVLLVLAAGFGWKLAEHLHFWHALEYGGSMVTPEEAKKARIRMLIGTVVYAAVAGFVALVLTG